METLSGDTQQEWIYRPTKNIFLRVIKHILDWNEYISIPAGLLLWYFSPMLLHHLDPTAATYDSGIFQIILFTLIQFLIYNGIVWLAIKLNFPGIYKFLSTAVEHKSFDSDKSSTPFQKMVIVMWIFTIYFLGIVLLSRVIGG